MASFACARSKTRSPVSGSAASPRFTSAELASMMKRLWRSGPVGGGTAGPADTEPAVSARGGGMAGVGGAGGEEVSSASSRRRLSLTLNVSSSGMCCSPGVFATPRVFPMPSVSAMDGGQSLACASKTYKEPIPLVYYTVWATPRSLMADSPGVLFEALLSLMGRLRGEGGCPWDREQTRASLRPYLIEETYEALEALGEGRTDHIVEELGDVLFQVVFHCQIAQEQGEFTMAEVLQGLLRKMTSRHPHVFADAQVADAREALHQWERIKRAEGSGDGNPRSALDGVPQSLPSLMRAQRLQVKAGRVGFDWPSWREAWNKVREELTETDEALAAGDTARIRAELGDLLFSVVNVARLLEIDAEDSLRQAAETFTRRFKEVEAAMRAEGRQVGEASAEDLDRKWEAAKSREVPGQDGVSR